MTGYLNMILIVLVTLVTGCATMCDDSHDCDFHAYGGMRDRQDRVHGRVASLFDPAAATPSLVPLMEPLPPDPSASEEEAAEDGPADGEVDDSGLTEELFDDLKERTDELPEVPAVPGSASGEEQTTEI